VAVLSSPNPVTVSPVRIFFNVTGIADLPLAPSANASASPGSVVNQGWSMNNGGSTASGFADVTLASGVNSVTVTFCDGLNPCQSGSTQVTYSPPPPPPAAGMPLAVAEPASQYRRSLAGCASCAYATLAYSTPAYHSLDQDRAVSLVYSSALSSPVGVVVLDVNPNSSSLPDKISLSLIRSDGASIGLVTGGTEVFYNAGFGTNRVTAQFDALGYATGGYDLTAVVRNWWGSTMQEAHVPVRVLIDNQHASPYGDGWSIAGLQRLVMLNGTSGQAVVVSGGEMVTFPSCGVGCWRSSLDEGSTLTIGAGSVVSRTYTDSSVATFDPFNGTVWLLRSVRDRLGNTTSYVHDGYARLTQITDPAGLVTAIGWTGTPGTTATASITTPGGRTSVLTMNGAGQLDHITDPDNVRALTVAYSGNRIVTATNRIGGTTTIAYDQYGGLTSVTGPAVPTTDRGVASSTTTYRSREMALLPAAGLGAFTAPGTRVFPDSTWLRARSQLGDSTRILANGAGDALAVVTRNPQGKLESTTTDYDSAGRPIRVISTAGTRQSYTWSGALVTQVKDLPANLTTDYAYNGFGQPTTVSVNSVLQQRNFYSAAPAGLLDSTTSGNSTTRFTYDARGRTLSMRDGAQHLTSLTYQSGGAQNLATVSNDGKTTQFGYDGYGRPSQVTDAASRTVTTTFDDMNRAIHAVGPDLAAFSWNYDDVNRSYTFTDAKAQLYRTVLNAAGMTVQSADPRLLSDYYGYDSDGALSTVTTRGMRSVTIAHDLMGRDSLMSGGGLVTSFAYDTASKWTAYGTAEATDTVFTDDDGRVAKQVTVRGGQRFTLTTVYGDLGEPLMVSATSPLWTGSRWVNSAVDPIGRPNYVGDFAGRGTSIAYNADSRPETIKLPTGSSTYFLTHSMTYAANDGLSNVTHNYGANALDKTYSYDVLNRLSVLGRGSAGDGARRTVGYDVAGRLRQVADTTISPVSEWVCPTMEITDCYWSYSYAFTPGFQESYAYDATGNRTDRGGVTTTGNRLTSFDGFTIGYDDDGNVTSKSGNGVTQAFVWNAFGQLTSVTTNGTVTTFAYDGLGRRIRKTTNGVTTAFLYDGDNLIMQLDGAGQPQLEFSYYPGVDHPHHVINSNPGSVYYYETTQPGNVTSLVDINGTVVDSYEYTPFGKALTTTEQVNQPFRFAARQMDSETGLYYYRARYYDPALARFLSEDPIGLAGGVNPYAYVGNDPINATDPYGLCPVNQLIVDGSNEDGTFTVHCPGGASFRFALHSLPPRSVIERRDPCRSCGLNQNPSARGLVIGLVQGTGAELFLTTLGERTNQGPTNIFISADAEPYLQTCPDNSISFSRLGITFGLRDPRRWMYKQIMTVAPTGPKVADPHGQLVRPYSGTVVMIDFISEDRISIRGSVVCSSGGYLFHTP
jgi:RHS repeat-associated protein